MICRDVQSLLNRYLDGELPAAEHSRVVQHLSVCEDCRKALEDLRMLAAVLAKAPAPPAVPNGFAERVMAQANRRSEPPAIMRQWYSFSPWMRFAAAAVLLLGIALGAMMAGSLSWNGPAAAGVSAANPVDLYGVDYLSGTPDGSLANTVCTLASADK